MKHLHNAYYDSITPESSNAEFLGRVLRKAGTMDNKKTYNKKPLIIAAAAAITLCAGVSAAAATGLLDFNSIFGNAITAEDEQLGAALLGGAANVRHSVSDENYVVSLNGVTGSPASMFVSLEISRADGQPIGNKDTFLDVADVIINRSLEDYSGARCSYGFKDSGSIFIEYEQSLSFDKLLEDDCALSGETTLNGTLRFNDNGELVDLEWQTDFDYTPSAQSLKTLALSDAGTSCTLNCHYFNSEELITPSCTIEKLRLTGTGGAALIKLDRPALFIDLNHDNTLLLIKTDGSEVIAAFSGGYSTETDCTAKYEISFYTDDTLCHPLAVDLGEIAAISINGTVFELV